MDEVAYQGNLGIHEMMLFYDKASESEKKKFQDLMERGRGDLAMKMVEKVVGYKLHKESKNSMLGLLPEYIFLKEE